MLIDAPFPTAPHSPALLRIVGGMTTEPENTIRPLTDQEQGWIDHNWKVSTDLLMTVDTAALTRGYLLARADWDQAPADQRPPAEHAVVGLGALAGQFICNHTDYQWGVRGEGNTAQWVIHNDEGTVIEPMKHVADIWTGASPQTIGGFVDEVIEGYSGER